MVTLILSSLFGFTVSCSGAECANGLSASIDISATVMSNSQMAIDIQPTSIANIYRLDIEYELNHLDKAGIYKESYLVLDSNKKLESQTIIANLDTDIPAIDLDIPLTVLAVRWPIDMTEQEVLAFYEVPSNTKQIVKK